MRDGSPRTPPCGASHTPSRFPRDFCGQNLVRAEIEPKWLLFDVESAVAPRGVRGAPPAELQPIQKSKTSQFVRLLIDSHSFGAVCGGCFGTRLAVVAEWGLRC